jgi:hypothetical protein
LCKIIVGKDKNIYLVERVNKTKTTAIKEVQGSKVSHKGQWMEMVLTKIPERE